MSEISSPDEGYYDLQEAQGKVVQSMRVYDDPPYGREVVVMFTDGTELSVYLEVRIKGDIKHYRAVHGELETLSHHKDV